MELWSADVSLHPLHVTWISESYCGITFNVTPKERITLGKKTQPSLDSLVKHNQTEDFRAVPLNEVALCDCRRQLGLWDGLWVLHNNIHRGLSTGVGVCQWANPSFCSSGGPARGNNGTCAHLSSLLSQLSFIILMLLSLSPFSPLQRSQASS